MSNYNDNHYESEVERKTREADNYLRSHGFVRNEFGHYEDPDNITRTGASIDCFGNMHRDM